MKKISKALVAGFTAAAAAFTTAMQDGQVTNLEWVTVAASAVIAGYAVWQVRNQPEAGPGRG